MTCPYCSGRKFNDKQQGDGWTVYHGKSEIVLQLLDDASVDAIVSDPPYAAGSNSLLGRLASSNTKYRSSGAERLPDLAGESMLPEAWSAMMRAVLNECHRVAKPGADLLFFCDWRSLPGMLAAIGEVGFSPRNALVWNKGRGSRPTRNGFRRQSELILWARKSGQLERSGPDVYLDGVFNHSTLTNKQHLTQKPVALMRDLLQIVTAGGTVLDPFQGAGTTGVAALELGLTYIGVEAVPDYHAIAVDRLRHATVPAAA